MNTGQTMMTVGAMVLLGYSILSTNQSNLTHGVILQQTEIGIYMISLAISRIEEASGKAFDVETEENIATSPSALTAANSSTWGRDYLGTDSAEVYPYFDDFDDYHNFSDTTYVPGVDNLVVKSTVRYVRPANPDSVLGTGTRTFHKRMDVIVYSMSFMDTTYYAQRDTLKMSYVFSYWSFR